MKKISYYLIFAVIIGGLLSSFWVYKKYFYKAKSNLLFFTAERGPLKELVRVRGEVVPQKEFDLEFPFSGIINGIFVKEGQIVSNGTPLMKLDTKDYELEVNRFESVLSQRRLNLEKLMSGPTEDDINISKTKVSNAKIFLAEVKKNVVDNLNNSYTQSDDAVRGKTNRLFTNPGTSNPTLDFTLSDSELKTDIEWNRFLIGETLDSWQASLAEISVFGNLGLFLKEGKDNLAKVKSFLDKVALAVNGLKANANLSQPNIDLWKTNVSLARNNVNAVITALLSAEQKMRTSESNLALAQKELDLKTSGARPEDIKIAKLQINEAENQISIAEEKIKKSILYAPANVKVMKIPIEKGELFMPGSPAIFLSSPGLKIRSDVSELDIGKVKSSDKNEVMIKFDALPDVDFSGNVSFIEPKKIIKDGDTYYRVNILFNQKGEEILPGMNADLEISISSKKDVLKIPEIVIYKRNGKNFVRLFEKGVISEREIKTGISDGESIEVKQGLKEGQTVIVSAD